MLHTWQSPHSQVSPPSLFADFTLDPAAQAWHTYSITILNSDLNRGKINYTHKNINADNLNLKPHCPFVPIILILSLFCVHILRLTLREEWRSDPIRRAGCASGDVCCGSVWCYQVRWCCWMLLLCCGAAANQGHNQPSAESAVRNIDTLQCPAATTAASPLQNGYPSGLQQIHIISPCVPTITACMVTVDIGIPKHFKMLPIDKWRGTQTETRNI